MTSDEFQDYTGWQVFVGTDFIISVYGDNFLVKSNHSVSVTAEENEK